MTTVEPKRHLLALAAPAALVTALLAAAPAPGQPRQFERQPRPETGIRVNTIGYLPGEVKRATVVGATAAQFTLVDVTSGEVAFTGALGEARHHADSQEEVRTADFTEHREAGEYALRVEGLPDSAPFRIAPGVYNKSLRLIMAGFYGQRCGVPVKLEHDGITYEKKACHLKDGYLDHYDPTRAGERKDGTGGWHDAGDYGKYVVNAAFATGIMLKAWEHYGEALARLELPIPEADGPLPDYLAEVKFNLDWLLKMQFPDGRVSHKLTRTSFSPMVMPSADEEKRYYVSWGTEATAGLAAVTAQAARVFETFDAEYAARNREVAEQAMGALRERWQEVSPDQSAFRTGGYLKPARSDRTWALVEMWETTGDERTRGWVERFLTGDNYLVDVDWDWGEGKNLGIYTYLQSARERSPAVVEGLEEDLVAAADRIVRTHDRHGYGRGLRSYYWGANGGVARTFLNLLMAERLTGERRYHEVAIDQLAYLYGRNPYARSFVTGDGHHPPMFPHHRPSVADGIVAPWPGHLVGGANPTELDWHDETEDPRTNENAINWDASLVYALAAVYDPAVE